MQQMQWSDSHTEENKEKRQRKKEAGEGKKEEDWIVKYNLLYNFTLFLFNFDCKRSEVVGSGKGGGGREAIDRGLKEKSGLKEG